MNKFKILVNTPDRNLFQFLQRNLTYQNLELFFLDHLSDVIQYVERFHPQLVITYIDVNAGRFQRSMRVLQNFGQNEQLWLLVLAHPELSSEKLHTALPNRKILIQPYGDDFSMVLHNVLTIKNLDRTISTLNRQRSFEEYLNQCLHLLYEEKDISAAFERLILYLPKVIPVDFLALFTISMEDRQVDHFYQFIPPTLDKEQVSALRLRQLAFTWANDGRPLLLTAKEHPEAIGRVRSSGWRVEQVYFIPIYIKNRAAGGIVVGNAKEAPLGSRDIRLLDEVSKVIANRLKNEYLAPLAQHSISTFSDQLISQHLDESAIFEHVCRVVNEVTHADSTIYWQFNKGFGFLFPKFHQFREKGHVDSLKEKNVLFLEKEKFLQQLIDVGKTQILTNLDANKNLDAGTQRVFSHFNYRHLLVLPLCIGPEIAGAIMVNKAEPKTEFSLAEIHQAEELVKRIQKVLEDAQAVKEAQLKLKQLARIFELGNEIKLDLSLPEILARISSSLRKTLGWNDVAILLIDEARQRFNLTNRLGFDESTRLSFDFREGVPVERFNLFLEECNRINEAYFFNSQPFVPGNNHMDIFTQPITEWQDSDLLIVPLETRNKVMGYLIVHDPVDRLRPTEEKITPLEYYANQAAVAVENSLLYEQLRASQERYRSLAETMSLGLVTCDLEGKVNYINPAFRELVQLDEEQVLDQHITSFFARRFRESLKQVIKQLTTPAGEDACRVENLEFTLLGKGRSGIPVSLYGFQLLQRSGQPLGFFLIVNDLRMIKRLEQMKADFNSMIVHDLRSPMNVIQGFIELIRNKVVGEINQEQAELLDIAKENVKKVLALIDNFLVAAKLEAGKFRIEAKLNELNAILEQQVENHKVLVKNKNITINMELDRNLPLLLFDTLRIEQVISNLLSNAMKFTPENGLITVTSALVRQKNQDEEKFFARVSVQDTGVGIPRKKLTHVFDKYEQVHGRQELNLTGTGLGLSICREIVELHGGEIWAESEEGQGSVFSFTIPIEPSLEKVVK